MEIMKMELFIQLIYCEYMAVTHATDMCCKSFSGLADGSFFRAKKH